MNLDRPWWRVSGLLVLIAALTFYDPSSLSALQRLWIPLIMAAGTWALVQNLSAVALGITVLAFIHSDPGAADWIDRLAYPGLAATGAVTLLAILARRFRQRISDTHAARWSDRSPS